MSRGEASPNTRRVSFAQVRFGEEVPARVASRRERRRARDKRTKTGNDPIAYSCVVSFKATNAYA